LTANEIIFIDFEVDPNSEKVLDIGALKGNHEFHSNSLSDFSGFLRGNKYVCGHNILKHDLKYLEKEIAECEAKDFIDTLYLSPLMFPKKMICFIVPTFKSIFIHCCNKWLITFIIGFYVIMPNIHII
jgi:ATP-dependent DNA helicase RecQ